MHYVVRKCTYTSVLLVMIMPCSVGQMVRKYLFYVYQSLKFLGKGGVPKYLHQLCLRENVLIMLLILLINLISAHAYFDLQLYFFDL